MMTLPDDTTLDPRALRRAFGSFATGVTITTTLAPDGQPVGFTANSFASVSLDPPLLMVCLAETASSWPAFRDAGFFAVNVLSEAQREVSTRFATRGADKFGAVRWRAGVGGAPLIDDTVAWFDCRTERILPAGDHAILLGRVLDFGCSDGAPLGYCRGAYVRFGLDGAAFTPHPGGVRVSAIIEQRGAVLLREDEGRTGLPSAAAFGPPDEPRSLLGQLAGTGLTTNLPFVFASYDADGAHHVVYRGLVPPEQQVVLSGWRFVPLADLPYRRMDAAEADLLRLYGREREAWAYGRYVGDALTWVGG
jgi:flavin reductase (DIM6/NTAB) family NADH-FMN oxidoreductase RutF